MTMLSRLMVVCGIAAGCCFGQIMSTTQKGSLVPPQATFASPPSSPTTGSEYTFTDASASGVCSGGGSAIAKCRWSGSVWQSLSTGSAGAGFNPVGATADYRIVAGCSIGTGSPNLTCPASTFSSGDTTKVISVWTAAGSGNNLLTTISTFTDNAHVVLAANASATVSNVSIEFGTDAFTAIDAKCTAIKAAGGGNLYFPKGDYIVGPYENIAQQQPFCQQANNILITGDGPGASNIHFIGMKGVYLVTQGPDINRFCTHPPSTGCVPPTGYVIPSYYIINAVSSGATVTTTTAGDAAHFHTGDTVFIESGDGAPGTGESPKHFEWNKVASANAGTGAVVLVNQLTDAYDNGDSNYLPMMAVTTTGQNMQITNLSFTGSQNLGVILQMGQNSTVSGCTFTGLAGNSQLVYNGYSWQLTIKGNTFNNTNADIGDAAGYYNVVGNVFNGGAASGWLGSYTGRDWVFDSNQFNGIKLSVNGGTSNQFRRFRATNNLFQLSSTATFPSGVGSSYADGSVMENNACFGPVAGGNGGSCIAIGTGSSGFSVKGNRSTSPSLAYGTISSTGASGTVYQNNTFTGSDYGIVLASGTTNAVIGCNTFGSNGIAAISDSGTSTSYQPCTASGSSGKAICWKTTTTLGYCSTVVASDGSCTCN